MVRFKHRYFTVEIIPDHLPKLESFQINSHELTKGILNCIQELHGDFGVAAVTSGFKAKYCNPATRIGVIRSRHGPHRLVASSLPFMKSLQNKPVMLRTLYTGATLKQCFKFAVAYQKKELMKVWNSLPNNKARDALKNSFMDLSAFQEMELSIKVSTDLNSQTDAAD
uniref:Ribonuclease P/MRP protein subunit POP5 n=1 Tax=Cuerna arida TaxID=1464854 RepID=A0A1B6GM52_9HEMI